MFPMQQLMALESSVLQFAEAAVKAAATVEIIERSPAPLRDAILRAVGDAKRILFAPPHELPIALFSEFAADPRVKADPTPDEMVHSAAGVTEAFAGSCQHGFGLRGCRLRTHGSGEPAGPAAN